jgi:hypothetical protein
MNFKVRLNSNLFGTIRKRLHSYRNSWSKFSSSTRCSIFLGAVRYSPDCAVHAAMAHSGGPLAVALSGGDSELETGSPETQLK